MALHINKDSFRGIQIQDKEIKSSPFILKDHNEVTKAIACINAFTHVSGLSLNIRKCELFVLKRCDLNSVCNIPVKNVITYLGIKVSKDQKEMGNFNFSPIVEKIGKRFNSWLLRDLSSSGRVLLSQSECPDEFISPLPWMFLCQ
jgi:predicted transcriptional regulator YheO